MPADFAFVAARYLQVTSVYMFATPTAMTPEFEKLAYMMVFETGAWLNLAAIFLLGAMTFVPVRFVLPLRVANLHRLHAPFVHISAAVAYIYLGVEGGGASAALPPLVNSLFLTLSLCSPAWSDWRSWSMLPREDTG